MNILSALVENVTRDMAMKKRQVLGTSIANVIVGVFVFFAMGFSSVAVALLLARTHGMVEALLIVSAIYMTLAVIILLAGYLYHQRLKKKRAETEALRNLYLTNMVSGIGKPNLLTLAGVALATFLASKK